MRQLFLLSFLLATPAIAQVNITSPSTLPGGVATIPYSYGLAASGGTAPYTWTIVGGQLPTGIGLNPGGTISGTASTATIASFTVHVVDSSASQLSASQLFSLTIAPDITTTSLSASTINQAYPNTSFSAAGLSGSPSWSATGLPSGMSISTAGILSGTPAASGSFTPTFSVSDPSGAIGAATIPLTIDAAPLITDASPLPSGDIALPVPYSYQFGSNSPVSGGTPPFTWSSPSILPPGMGLSSSGLLSGTPTQAGLFTFNIQVQDSSGATNSKTFALAIGTLPIQVTILRASPASTAGVPYPPPSPANQPPYFQATRVSGTYSWSSSGLPSGLAVSPTSGSLVGITGNPGASGSFPVTVSATDQANGSAPVNFTLTINPAPVIGTTPLQACTAGTSCTRTLTVSGGTAPLSWTLASGSVPPGMSFSSAGVISGIPNAVASPTSSSFTVTVTDSATATNTQQFSLMVNPALTISPSTLPATTSTASYSQTISASGGTGSITLTSTGLPSWLTLNSSGVLSGIAPQVSTPTLFSFSIKATDADNATATASYSVMVNSLPSITSGSPLPSWTVNRLYSQTITATGGTGTLTFADAGSTLPTWLTITSAGLLSGTPPTAGTVNFTLKVIDSVGASSTKAFSLTINPGPSVTTTSLPATTSTIQYSQTLAETGGTPSFSWQATGLPTWLTLSPAGVLSGSAPIVPMTTAYGFDVTVVDSAGAASAQQSLSVTVNPPIQITTTSPLPATGMNASYSQTLAATGGTGTITWSGTGLPTWLALSPAGVLSGTAPAVISMTAYSFGVTATDSVTASASKNFSVTVNPGLTITSASPLPSWTVNRPYSQTITAAGGTGTLTFSDAGTTLPTWLTISGAGLLSGTPPTAGTVSFTLKVTDSLSAFATKVFTLTINPAPSVNTTSLPATTSNIVYGQTLTETGGTGPFTWQATNLPAWLAISPAGVLSGTAPAVTGATKYSFSVTVGDAAGAVSAAQNLSVTVNPALQITTASPLPTTVSELSYSQAFAATGGTGTVTFSSANLPAWLTLSPAGALTGTAPAVISATPYSFNVAATDSVTASVSKAFTVTVNPGLTFTSASPLPSWTVNRLYAQTITAAGGTGTLTFSDAGATLPAWLNISSAGLLSGTPPAAGTVSFTLKVTDSASAFATKVFALTINPAPSVTTTSLPATTSNIVYGQTLAETGGTPPFTWQASNLPSWLSISPAGVLSGTAPAVTAQTAFSFSVAVADAAGALSTAQNLSVTVNPAIQITTASPLPAAASGVNYSQTLGATGGTGTIAWSSANLPAWLTLSPAGALTGTPPTVTTSTPYNFNVTATDSVTASAGKAFTVSVSPAVTVTITTASPLPASTVNRPYSQNISATGGTAPYTFADAGTTLPQWLSISSSGSLTGTPPAAGTFNFTLSATGSSGGSGTKSFTLTINPAPSITTSSLPATTSQLTYSQTLTESGGTAAFTYSAASLPSWLTLTGAVLSGTAPIVSERTSYTFSVTVTDTTGSVSAPQPLSIAVDPPVVITTSNPLPSVGVGASYSQTFSASGGTGTITWTFGNRPSWLTQNGAVLTGTAPNVSQLTPYSFTATATDSLGATSGSQSFTVTVGSGVVIITGASLGPWTATRNFSVTLSASGGTGPYVFSSQNLPTWLAFNGSVLNGTPPAAGSFSFTVTAVDSLQATGQKTFTLTVNPVPSVTTTSLPATTSNLPYSQALSATGGTPPLVWNGTNAPSWLTVSGPSVAGTAPAVITPTQYPFQVSVTDQAGAISAAQPLSVMVNPPVTITTASPLPQAAPSTAYSVVFAATGGTGTLSWSPQNLPTWLTLSGATLSGTPPPSAAGSVLNFSIRATDTLGAFALGSFQLTVSGSGGGGTNGGTLPPWTVSRPYSTTLSVTGGTAPYSNWIVTAGAFPAGLQLNATTGVLSGTPTSVGPTSFTTSATDAASHVITANWTLLINATPSIPAQTLPPAANGQPYAQSLTKTGGTGPFTWSATGLAGSGMTLTSAGILTGVPTPTPPATINFNATLTDTAGATAQALLSLLVAPPISFTTGAVPATTSTASYSASIAASGGTGTVSFSASSGVLPGWLALSSQGALTGTAPTVAIATDFGFTITATDSVGITASKLFIVTVNPVPKVIFSRLPVGTVGAPYAAIVAVSGGTGALTWSAQNVPSWAKLNATTGQITGIPPAAANVSITVTVTDSLGIASSPTPLTLEIDPPGGKPVITVACPFNPTTSGLFVNQTATAMGGTPPYLWSATGLPSWLVLNPDGTLAGTAATGADAFTLEATDSNSQKVSLSCGITVNPAPAITPASLAPGTIGAPYAQYLTAFGGTGTLIWSAPTLPAWLSLDPLTGALQGTPSVAGDYSLVAHVTDSLGAISASASFTIAITTPGGAPTITACPLPAGSVGSPMSFQLTAALGFPGYTWSAMGLPAGLTASSAGLVTGTPATAGRVSVALGVTDSASLTASATCALNISAKPSVTTSSLPGGTVGTFYWESLAASGGVGLLRWSIAGAPTWMILDPIAGVLSGTPDTAGATPFTVQVTDSQGTTSPSVSLSVNVAAPGGGFTISTGCPLPQITQGMLLAQPFTATGGIPPYSWTAAGLPSSVTLSSSGVLLGTPAAGLINFTVQATDQQQQQTQQQSCSVLVNPAPAITTTSLPNGVAGTPYTAHLAATGGTGAVTWSAGAPYWLQIDPVSGALSGTPPTAGAVSASIRASDGLGIAASTSLSFTVAAPSSSSLPALTSTCPLVGATAGVSYSQTLAAGGGLPPYQFFVSGLPLGLMFASNGTLSGTALTAGTAQLVVEVIDANGNTATAPCGLTVAAASGLTIVTSTPDGTVNQSYSGAFTGTGGVAPYSWSITSGSLPPGISLNSATGALSGTPTAVGTFTFTVKVTDFSSSTFSVNGTINIVSTLAISTPGTLPAALGGSTYRQTLTATGFVGTVTWSIVSGALPAGLTLDTAGGVIAGTPTLAGTFPFTVQASDTAGQKAQQKFTVTVSLPPLPQVTITGLSAAVSPNQQPTAVFTLAAPYPLDITGQLNLTITADPSIGLTDPAVQFAGGGLSAPFVIAANSTQAVFTPPASLQTGTLAGTLKLDVTLQSGGTTVQPPSSAAISGQIAKLAPVIVGTPTVTRTSTGVTVTLIAYATSREVTGATFQFTGASVQTTSIPVSLSSLVGAWYSSSASDAFGSLFQIVQPFTIQGNSAQVTGVTITLTNSVGSSTPVTVAF